MNVLIILGSVREQRQGHKAAKFAEKYAKEKGWNTTVIDPLEYKLPLLDKRYFEIKDPWTELKKLHDLILNADGYILVTAEYNNSVPPALKNLLDYFYKEYFYKPSGIVSYSTGAFGGVRAAEQLRLICAELGMPSIKSSVPIPNIQKSLSENGIPQEPSFEKWMNSFLKEFEWYMEALKRQRETGLP